MYILPQWERNLPDLMTLQFLVCFPLLFIVNLLKSCLCHSLLPHYHQPAPSWAPAPPSHGARACLLLNRTGSPAASPYLTLCNLQYRLRLASATKRLLVFLSGCFSLVPLAGSLSPS